MRVYLDYQLDESYTPTKMTFWGGIGMHDLVCAIVTLIAATLLYCNGCSHWGFFANG